MNKTMSIALVALILLVAGITAAAAGNFGASSSRVSPQPASSGATVATVVRNSPRAQMLPAATTTPAAPIDLEARLTGGASHPDLRGKADYEVDRDGDREFEVGVRGAAALAGQTLDVFVDGVFAGSLTVDGNGFGRLKLDSERGHAVPVVNEGSTVELRLGGVAVSAGAFVVDTDDDDDGDVGSGAIPPAPTTRVDLEARLTGGASHPGLRGKADYEVDRDGDREFEVGVRGAAALSGQTLDVFVDGVLVGSLTVDGNGFGRLKLDSERGHTVPVVNEGSTVELRLGGAAVSAGAFVVDTDDDDDGDVGGGAIPPVPTTRVDLEARLTGGASHPDLRGKADYEVDRDGDREFEVGVRGAAALAGQTLDVFVDGVLVGSLTVDGNGFGRLKLDSERGHAVPVVNEGSTVELRLGGAAVSAGAFVVDADDDDIDDIDDDDDDDDHDDDDDYDDDHDDDDDDDDDDYDDHDDDDDDHDDD